MDQVLEHLKKFGVKNWKQNTKKYKVVDRSNGKFQEVVPVEQQTEKALKCFPVFCFIINPVE